MSTPDNSNPAGASETRETVTPRTEAGRGREEDSRAVSGSEIVRRLETYCRGRREVIEASIACERLAGNAPKEMAERMALAEITGFEIWMAGGGLSQNAGHERARGTSGVQSHTDDHAA